MTQPTEASASARCCSQPEPEGARKLHSSVGFNKTLIAQRKAAFEVIKKLERLPEPFRSFYGRRAIREIAAALRPPAKAHTP